VALLQAFELLTFEPSTEVAAARARWLERRSLDAELNADAAVNGEQPALWHAWRAVRASASGRERYDVMSHAISLRGPSRNC